MRKTFLAFLFCGLMLSAVVVLADNHTVTFDNHTDFSTLKTFAMRDGKIDASASELNNSLVLKTVTEAIRKELVAKGLKETVNNPDLLVDFHISTEEFSEQRGGPTTSTEGTLVVDMTKRDSRALVWRGVYRDTERNNAKLAQNLPADVKKFVSQYPPKQKGPIAPGPSTLAASVAPKMSPKDAAVAALDIVKAATSDAKFIGPAAHPGLAISLGGLERAARAVTADDGRNVSATTQKHLAFYQELNDAVEYAKSIASRNVETADSRSKARDLAGKLLALTGA